MPITTDQQQSGWITDRLRNQFGAAEGTSLPSKLQHGIRVPVVNNFKVLQTVSFNGGTQATVSWDVPNENATLPIGSFLLSLKGITNGTPDVSMTPTVVLTSPAVIRINSQIATVCTVSIQTVLNNGQTSLIENSPTVSINTIAPVITATDIPSTTLVDLSVLVMSLETKNTSFTAGNTFTYICDASSGNITVTLPSASSNSGKVYIFKKSDTSTNTVIVGSAFTLRYKNESIFIQSDGSNWLNISHSIS